MINFRISNINEGLLTIEKPSGKAINLKMGEIVRAEVIDILPSGSVTLKIKGDFLTAKSDISLLKGFTALFKVASLPPDSGVLSLQFMDYDNKGALKQNISESVFNLKDSTIPKLMTELSKSIANASKAAASSIESLKIAAKIQNINSEILKALPPDINALPKEVRLQLQILLQTSLRISGESMQSRLESIINQLPESIKNHPSAANIKTDLLVGMDKLLQTPMKKIFQDTGILLEAKLKAIAELIRQTVKQGGLESPQEDLATGLSRSGKDSLLQNIKQTPQPPRIVSEKLVKGDQSVKTILHNNVNVLKSDLKGGLLQLKQLIIEEGNDTVKGIPSQDFMISQKESSLKIINSLLRDIETFQLLSKTTDSFYTFLPLNWKELRDGEIAFRKGRGYAGGASYSCRINLELERFGRLSAVVLMLKGEFSVSFNAENRELHEILINNSEELHDSFKSGGLHLKAINILDTSENSHEHMERLESFENIVNLRV